MASIYLNSCAAAKRLAARPSSFRQQWLLHPAVAVGAFFSLPVPAASGDMFRLPPSHSLACCGNLLRIPDGATVQASIGTYQLSDASRRTGGGIIFEKEIGRQRLDANLTAADVLAIAARPQGVLLVVRKNKTRVAGLNAQPGSTGAAVIGSVLVDSWGYCRSQSGGMDEPRHRMKAFPGRPVDPVGRNILRSRQRAVEHRLRKV